MVSTNLFVRKGQLTASRTFWEEGLGIPLGRAAESLLTFYLGDNTQLNIHESTPSNEALAARHTGLGLRVPAPGDLARVTQRLQSRGVTVASGQIRDFMSSQSLTLTGPAGNTICLLESEELSDQPHMFDAPAFVAVSVSHMRRSLDFYVGRLEMPMLDQIDQHTVRLLSEGTQIVLCERRGTSPTTPVSGDTGICLGVRDPEYAFGQLAGRGVAFRDTPTTLGNTMLASVSDPDGNTLNLMGTI